MCFFCFFWLLKDFGESLRVTILSPLLRIESGKMFSGDKKGPNGHVLVILMVFWCFHMLTCTTCLMKIMEPYQIQYPNISEKILQIRIQTCMLFVWVCGVLWNSPTKTNPMLFRFKFHHHPMTTMFDAFFWSSFEGFGTTDKLSGPGNPQFLHCGFYHMCHEKNLVV